MAIKKLSRKEALERFERGEGVQTFSQLAYEKMKQESQNKKQSDSAEYHNFVGNIGNWQKSITQDKHGLFVPSKVKAVSELVRAASEAAKEEKKKAQKIAQNMFMPGTDVDDMLKNPWNYSQETLVKYGIAPENSASTPGTFDSGWNEYNKNKDNFIMKYAQEAADNKFDFNKLNADEKAVFKLYEDDIYDMRLPNKNKIYSDYMPIWGVSKERYNLDRKSDFTLPEWGSKEYFEKRKAELETLLKKMENDSIYKDEEENRGKAKAWEENHLWSKNPELIRESAELSEKFKKNDKIAAEYKQILKMLAQYENQSIELKENGEVDYKKGIAKAEEKQRQRKLIGNAGVPWDNNFAKVVMENQGMAAMAGEKERAYKYYKENKDNKYDDNLWERFTGNYKLGRIGIKSNDAGYVSFANNSGDIEAAQVYNLLSEKIQSNNAKTFVNETGFQRGVANIAQYAPQGIDQILISLPGRALSLVSAPLGAAISASASAKYMYSQTAGAAYVRLLSDYDISKKEAQILAQEEAISSSIVEFGLEFGAEMLLSAGKSAYKAISKTGIENVEKQGSRLIKKLVSKGISQNTAEKVIGAAKTAGKYAIDTLGEGLEEGIQEGISINIDKYARNGKTPNNAFGLLLDSLEYSQYSDEEKQRIKDSGVAGMVIGGFSNGARFGIPAGVRGAVKLGGKAFAKSENVNNTVDSETHTDYIEKAPERQTEDVQAPFRSARNASADVASDDIVTQGENNVKTEDGERVAIAKDGQKVRYSIMSFSDEKTSAQASDTLAKKIYDNRNKLLNTEKAFDVDESSIERAQTPSMGIFNLFKKWGGKAVNPQLGTVELTKKGEKSTVGHGISENKYTAAAAIKDVIEKGTVIDKQETRKGRGYDTYVIAAQGNVNNENSIVGVIVKSYSDVPNANDKFYLHEIIKVGDVSDTVNGITDSAISRIVELTPTNDNISYSGQNVKVKQPRSAYGSFVPVPQSEWVDSFGPHGQRVVSNMNPDVRDTGSFQKAVSDFYELGYSGMEFDKAYDGIKNFDYGNVLSELEARRAHQAGMKDGARIRGGGVIADKAARVQIGENVVRNLNNIAKKLRVTIEFVKTLGDSNGLYQNGKIYIALDADNPYIVVASHEITHHMQALSKKAYEKFRNMAVRYEAKAAKMSSADLVDAKRNAYAEHGRAISRSEALDEIAADFTQKVFSNNEQLESFLKRIAAENPENKGVLKKFSDSVRAVLKAIGEHIPHKDKITLEKTIKRFDEAFKAAERNAGTGKEGENSYKKLYQLKENLGQQLNDWMIGKGKKYGLYNGEYFDLGTTPDVFVKHGAKKLPVVMTEDCVVKVTGGKHAISLDEIAKLPMELNDPVLLFDSSYIDRKGNKQKAFVALTEMVDKYGNDIVVAVHINKYQYRMTINRIASLYSKSDEITKENHIKNYVMKQIKEGNLLDVSTKKAPIWFTIRGLQLPKMVQTIIDANNNISQNDPAVNTNSTQNSENYSSDSAKASVKGASNVEISRRNTVEKRESKKYNKNIKIPYNESVQLRDYIMHENNSGELKAVDCKSIGNNFYIWENDSRTGYTVTGKIKIEGNEDLIKMIRNGVERDVYKKTEEIRRMLNELDDEYGNDDRRGVVGKDRQSNIADGKIPQSKRRSDGRGDIAESHGDSGRDGRNSIKGTSNQDIAERSRLDAEDAKLKKQLKTAKKIAADFGSAMKQAKAITAYTSSKAEKGKIAQGISEIMGLIKDGAEFSDIKDKAFEVSKELIESAAVLDDGEYIKYKALRDMLRNRRIAITEEIKQEFGGEFESFRKSNMGSMLFSYDGEGIDSIYQELSLDYPEFFDYETESDPKLQLEKISEVLSSLKPTYENPYSSDMEAAIQNTANKILRDIVGTAEKESQRRKKKIEKAVLWEKERREKQVAAVRDYYLARIERSDERRQKSLVVGTIRNRQRTLNSMLKNPNNTRHIPTVLSGPVSQFLNDMGQISRLFVKGEGSEAYKSGAAETMVGSIERMQSAYINLIADYVKDVSMANGILLDADLTVVMQNCIDGIKEDVENGNVRELRDLSRNTLNDISTCLRGIENMVRTANKLIDSKIKVGIFEAGMKVISENSPKEINLKSNKVKDKISGYASNDLLSPETFFHKLGRTAESVYKEVRDSENKRIENTREVIRLYGELRKISDIDKIHGKKAEVYTFNLKNGKVLELTKGQIMELYLLSRQTGPRGAAKNIYEGGISVAEIKKSRRGAFKYQSAVKVDNDDVQTIIGTLSKEEMVLANRMGRYMEIFADWGNEVSDKLYGYEKFRMKNYWPKKIDRFSKVREMGNPVFAQTLEGFSAAKTREENMKPVEIGDAVDTLLSYGYNMATYNAYVIPISNFKRVMSFSAEGQSVQRAITLKNGNRAVHYINEFLRLVNGEAKSYEAELPFSSELIRNYKISKVGLSITTFLKQFTAYVKAGIELNLNSVIRPTNLKKADIEKMYKYAPIAQWKSWGFYGNNMGPSIEALITGGTFSDKLHGKMLYLAGKADDFTWRRIWNACIAEVKSKTDLEYGTEEFYKKVGKQFNEVIYNTQVVDSIFQKPMILNSENKLTQMQTVYMAEPITSYNILYRAFYDACNGGSKKKLAKSIGLVIVTMSLSAAVTTGTAWLMGDDDDDETDYRKEFLMNLVGEALSIEPWIKSVYSILDGFNAERLDMDLVSDLVGFIKKVVLGKYTWSSASVIGLGYVSQIFMGTPVRPIKKDISIMLGALGRFMPNQTYSLAIEYFGNKYIFDMKSDTNAELYKNMLFKAYVSGDEKLYKKIKRDMMSENPEKFNSDELAEAMKNKYTVYMEKHPDFKPSFRTEWNFGAELRDIEAEDDPSKADYIAKLSFDESEEFTEQTISKFDELTADVRELVSDLDDETYNSVVRGIERYSEDMALYDVTDGEYEPDSDWVLQCADLADTLGISEGEFIYYKAKYTYQFMSSEKTARAIDAGMDIDQYAEIKRYYNELEPIRNAAGKVVKNRPEQLREHLKGQGYSSAEVERIENLVK